MVEQSRGQLAAYAVVAVLAVVAALKLLGPHHRGAEAGPAPVRLDRSPGGGGTAGGGGVYVHVAGAVRRPGLYRLPASARVATALKRAGGPAGRADVNSVNLAAKVEDGQQVVVPRAHAAGSAGGGSGGKVSLGSATPEQLDGLDGIGPTLAKRIVDFRRQHGGFRSLDDLRDVEGIGDKRLEALRRAVSP